MLSRRRRVSSSSIRLVDLDEEQVSRTRDETDVLRLRTSTETSTSTLAGPSMPASDSQSFTLSSRHVDNRGSSPENGEDVKDAHTDGRRRPKRSHEILCDCVDEERRCSDFSDSTSLAQQHNPHRQQPRLYENSRRRRRKIMRILDNPSIVQNPTTNPPHSSAPENSQTFFRINEEPSRISEPNEDGSPAESIPQKTPNGNVHTTYSRTSRVSFEARPRLKNHEIQDFVHEHKSSRRRVSSSPHSTEASTRIVTRYGKTVWTQLTSSKYRYPVILGLLLWTIMMIPEVSGRQSHHRTCPGCPHQHVHTINRKAAPIESSPSDESETAPSPDDLRLEAIKHQILTKLGLRTRPDVNRTLTSVPRHLALETLYRTEAQPVGYSGVSKGAHEGRRRDHHRHGDNEDEDSLSSSSSSSSSSPSSSSTYGQYYYDGEEHSYRNIDPGLDDNSGGRDNDDGHRASLAGHHFGDDGGYARGRHGNVAEESPVELDDFYARTSEIITFAEPGCTLNGQPLFEFPRSSSDPALEPMRIKKATLWARVELRHPHHYQHHRRGEGNQRNITLWVFRVRCGNVTHLRGKKLGQHLHMVTSLSVNVNQLGWQKFEVTEVVNSWYSGHESTLARHEKLTLLVDCTGCGSHVHVSTFGVEVPNVVDSSVNAKGEQDPDRPFLVVRTDPAAVKRVRRRAIECSEDVTDQCCKQKFYVSFSQLGWDDWIIAPEGYHANYCKGDCAARHRTPDTFHNYYTHVIEEYRKMDKLAGMQPCCAPVKFSPMSLIYYGPDSNIIKRDLPKMVVDECGCP